MLKELVRSLAPFVVDAVNLPPRYDPDFRGATWVTGATPGSLISAAPISPVGLGTRLNEAEAWRIDYVTSDSRDRTLTATGAVFRSRVAWSGSGPRPTVAFAPSTQGVAPRCDPSYSCTVGLALRTRPIDVIAAYEQPVINFLIAQGLNVVLSDYPREPTGNVQYYCDNASAARALADAVRAARHLGVRPNPLGLWGFSQGGGAVGAWLEEPNYSPELTPAAAVVGSPPADLVEVLKHLDGALPSAVILYCVSGLMAAYPEVASHIDALLTDRGREALLTGANLCGIGATLKYRYARTETWTTPGLPLGELLDRVPHIGGLLDSMGLGHNQALPIPIRLWASPNDDIIPYPATQALAAAWGVSLQTRAMPRIPGRTGMNHIVPYYLNAPRDAQWLLGQLDR